MLYGTRCNILPTSPSPISSLRKSNSVTSASATLPQLLKDGRDTKVISMVANVCMIYFRSLSVRTLLLKLAAVSGRNLGIGKGFGSESVYMIVSDEKI